MLVDRHLHCAKPSQNNVQPAADWDRRCPCAAPCVGRREDTHEKGEPKMESSSAPANVLVVAHKTAATEPLLDAVRERAARGPAHFTLLVPNPAHGLHRVVDPEDQGTGEAQQVLDRALPALSRAAGSQVDGMIGTTDPHMAIEDAVNLRGFDEIIISTLSPRLSRWLRLDLPSKASGLGLPITTVTPPDET
jgi:hypothetical protein